MDTAMTNNWHQPIQSIGSSKGDDVRFKHMMRVYFQPAATNIPLDLGKDVVYEMEESYYPTDNVKALAMLMAEHSASIPDHYSTSYLPVNAWDLSSGNSGKAGMCNSNAAVKNPLLGMSLSAGSGKKRSLDELHKQNQQMSRLKREKNNSLDSLDGGDVESMSRMARLCKETIPDWIVAYMSKAMFSAGGDILSSALFTQCPWNRDKEKGFPEFVLSRDLDGTSLNSRKLPCIVHMVMNGQIKIHQKNWGAMWVAKKAKDSATKDKLVYMKCWHPACKLKVDEYREKVVGPSVGGVSSRFDCHGWALVCRSNLEQLVGSVDVDTNARI